MFQYGVFIDADMVRNIVETNRREALDYVNPNGLVWLTLTGILPSAWILRARVRFRPPWRELRGRLLSVLACALAFGLIAGALFKQYAIFGRNNRNVTRLINPTCHANAAWCYFWQRASAKRGFVRIDPLARRASGRGGSVTVLVVVIGETARSMNFSLNGYGRPTNPRLAGQDVISFRDVAASGTSTAVSLPAMFSGQRSQGFDLDEALHTENIVDLMAQVGYDVVWLENDNGCKRVCDRVTTRDMVAENDPAFCRDGNCLDGVLIGPLASILGDIRKDTVIFLHTIGSHGPAYHSRYPDGFGVFGPTCDTGEIQGCPDGNIVNTYDNTILYADHVLDLAITELRRHPGFSSWLLYVSDHGESLGEKGIYLHGLPLSIAPKEQTRVPMILWMSETMAIGEGIGRGCLEGRVDDRLSHDNLFHSLAGLLGIETSLYDEGLDLFAPCRRKPPNVQADGGPGPGEGQSAEAGEG
jgi:lipid A ethanolaminephosphotransferase